MKRLAAGLILGMGLLTPTVAVYAQEHEQARHEWSSNEDPYWHQYLQEHHKRDKDWSRASRREKTGYWKWRDQHQNDQRNHADEHRDHDHDHDQH